MVNRRVFVNRNDYSDLIIIRLLGLKSRWKMRDEETIQSAIELLEGVFKRLSIYCCKNPDAEGVIGDVTTACEEILEAIDTLKRIEK